MDARRKEQIDDVFLRLCVLCDIVRKDGSHSGMLAYLPREEDIDKSLGGGEKCCKIRHGSWERRSADPALIFEDTILQWSI